MNDMAEERKIDCRGLACPQPVLLTKKALEAEKAPVIVGVDNATAKENVVKFGVAHGWGAVVEEQGGLYHIRLDPPHQSLSHAEPVEPHSAEAAPVYLFMQEHLGQGSDELGGILMRSFFASLQEVEPKPKTLLFLNGGVKLTVQGSAVLPTIQKLEQQGVTVLSCGTCLDYFHLKEQLAVGSATNMFTILSELQGPGRAIIL